VLSELLTAVLAKIQVLWLVKPCRLIDSYPRVGRACCLQLRFLSSPFLPVLLIPWRLGKQSHTQHEYYIYLTHLASLGISPDHYVERPSAEALCDIKYVYISHYSVHKSPPLFLSQMRPLYALPFRTNFNIILSLLTKSFKFSLSLRVSHQNAVRICVLPHKCHIPSPPWCNRPNNTRP
jgi:hypothetical protein